MRSASQSPPSRFLCQDDAATIASAPRLRFSSVVEFYVDEIYYMIFVWQHTSEALLRTFIVAWFSRFIGSREPPVMNLAHDGANLTAAVGKQAWIAVDDTLRYYADVLALVEFFFAETEAENGPCTAKTGPCTGTQEFKVNFSVEKLDGQVRTELHIVSVLI